MVLILLEGEQSSACNTSGIVIQLLLLVEDVFGSLGCLDSILMLQDCALSRLSKHVLGCERNQMTV